MIHLADCMQKASAKLQKVHIRVLIQKWRELSSSQTVLRLEKSKDESCDVQQLNLCEKGFREVEDGS